MGRQNTAFILGMSVLVSLTVVDAAILYVRQGSHGIPPYSTPETAAGRIQEAVDAAEYGDLVSVGPGDYVERVTLREGVLLWGSGSGLTTIHRPTVDYSPVVTGAPDAEIRDLAIVSPEHPEQPWTGGTGLYLGPWAGQLVSDCTVMGPFRASIRCEGTVFGAPIVIRRCSLKGAMSAGVELEGLWGDCIIDDCDIRDTGSGLLADFGAFGIIRMMRTTISGSVSGVHLSGPWQARVENSTVERCTSHAIRVTDCAELAVSNTVISHSRSGIVADYAAVEMSNCTIAENHIGLLYNTEETIIVLANTVLWGADVPVDPPFAPCLTVKFSDIQGGYGGDGNIAADPLFVNASTGDFRLRPDSPCIDMGRPWESVARCSPVWLYAVDRAGASRRVYGGKAFEPDMGAYEFYINNVTPGPNPDETTLTWSSLAHKTYSIFYTDDLLNWHTAVENFPSSGSQTTSWLDDGSLTGVPPLLAPRRFYRLLENP